MEVKRAPALFVLEGRGRFTVGKEEAELGAMEATLAG